MFAVGIRRLLGVVAGLTLAVAVAPSTPARAAGAPQPLDVLVLGDSYSAGNGATDDQGQPETYGPQDCYRSKVNWSEKYAAALRAAGQPVNLVNHACSGGVTADFTSPRTMDTTSGKVVATPTGVTTTAQADAYLAQADPCNTHRFPDEEFWTYDAKLVIPHALTTYNCTRNLQPQADFVTPETDLVLFTNGGNDAGFSTIVADCFVPGTRSASKCKSAVDAARALLPTIQQRLIAGIAAMRAHGLRDDAKIVQLGYPWLQVDNNYKVGSYDAGNQVRSLVTDGDAAIAAIVPDVNAGHPGQLTFLDGVPQKFSGHEPDASTLTGNPNRWINQAGNGLDTSVWYHPNALGQQAYADLLTAQGTFGAPTSPTPTPPTPPVQPVPPATPVTAKLKVHLGPLRAQSDDLRLRVKITLSNGSTPQGKFTVRGPHGKLLTKHLRKKSHGKLKLTLHLRDANVRELKVIYRDKVAGVVRATEHVRGTS